MSLSYSEEREVIKYDRNEDGYEKIDNPYWLQDALTKLHQLSSLPQNWDGRNTTGITDESKKNVIKIFLSIKPQGVPEPHVVPVSGGGVQIEWQYKQRDLELEFSPDGEKVLFLKLNNDSVLEESELAFDDSAPSKIIDLIDWLAFS